MIHASLQTAAEASGLRYEYAGNLEEANGTIFDQILTGEFPVCLVLAFTVKDKRANGQVISTAEINMFCLDRVNKPTIDTPTAEIEITVITPMRSKAREVLNRLDHDDIIEGLGIEAADHISVHEALMDAHLYGTHSVFTVNFNEGLGLCVHG